MSRLNRRRLGYDCDYTSAPSASPWDSSRTLISIDDDSNDDDTTSRYSRITHWPSASVIGLTYYGDVRHRTTRPGTGITTNPCEKDNLRDHRDRNRVRVRHHHNNNGHSSGHRTSLKPSVVTTSLAGLTLVDHDKESLKQRLCLDRTLSSSSTTIATFSPATTRPFHAPHSPSNHPRARSLSLSRLPAGRSGYSSPEDDDDSGGGGNGPTLTHDWDSATTIFPSHSNGSVYGGGCHYHRERLSLSSPRVALAGAGWPLASSRPPSRSPSLERERHRTMPYRARRFEVDGDDDLRWRLGGGPRVLNGGKGIREREREREREPEVKRRVRPRSESFERDRESERWVREEGIRGKVVSPERVGERAASKFGVPKPQYNQVHALILTWSFHDLRTEDYTVPPSADYVSLEEETRRLRATLEGYGYTVHEFLIPMHRSVESLKNKLKQFFRYAADDTLLIVYYHGHGALDDDNELVFSSHDHPDNAEWSKNAAVELYAALMSGDTCPSHGRKDKYQQLLKKYERYRPVASIKWDAIRSPILSASCDVLLILDCCAAGGANLRHINWQPPPGTEHYTKHLFAACGFESSTSDDMTAAMCEVLDEWVPPTHPTTTASRNASPAAAAAAAAATATSGCGSAAGPVGGGMYLTTKRLHQLMEDRLQKRAVGSQPIFKQLLPQDPEQYITLPNLRRVRRESSRELSEGRGRRGYVLA
ncbi:hypothetical protein VTI74DRAFT_525 [Chaetomium olivicolor]